MEIAIQDHDVLKLIINFLQSKGYFWSANSLQLEADVIWDILPKPLVILKDCALDGRWKDVRKLLQPFHDIYQDAINWKTVFFLLYRQRFCELCFEGDLENASTALKDIVEEVTACHSHDEYDKIVEDVCNYYNKMLGKYSQNYALIQATRTDTFRQLLALIYPIFESNGMKIADDNSRLVALLAKGLLYDCCDNYCYERACGKLQQTAKSKGLKSELNRDATKPTTASLLGWIQSLKEEKLFQNKFVDQDVKIVQEESVSDQDSGTLLHSPDDQNKRERLDSTFVKAPVATALSTSQEGEASASCQGKITATGGTSFASNENNAASVAVSLGGNFAEEPVQNSSIRSAWGDILLPEVTTVPEQMDNGSFTQVIPLVSQDGDSAPLQKVPDTLLQQLPSDNPAADVVQETAAVTGHPTQEALDPSANPALWAQPGNAGSTSLKASIRRSGIGLKVSDVLKDSYADFINEQSIARRDYNQLMDQLQTKQHEAQALRNFLQGGDSLLSEKNVASDQHSYGVPSYPGGNHYTSRSVDNNARSKEIRQQFVGKTPHTDRGVAVAPQSRPIAEQPKILAQQTSHIKNSETANPRVTGSILQGNVGEKLPDRVSQPKKETVPVPPSNIVKATSQQHVRHYPQTISSEAKQPAAYQLPFDYVPIYRTDDPAVIRSVAFHPRGHVMAIGSNSRVLKLCAVPETAATPASRKSLSDSSIERLQIIMKKSQVHRGSIYALAWNDSGNILSTCSNDKLIKIFTFDEESLSLQGPQYELTHHDGMVRDVTFLRDYGSGSVLASGGSTDFVVYTYACEVDTVVHQLTGHSDQILSLYSWDGGMLASASQDRSVRIWDLRSSRCVSVLGFGKSSDEHSVPTSVCVDRQGHRLGVGRDDTLVSVYDLRAGRLVGDYGGHSGEVRSVRFNPINCDLLTSSSYDGTALVTNINLLFNGSMALPFSSRRCNFHTDKVIQCRWHHQGACFATTSADQSCVLWRTIEA